MSPTQISILILGGILLLAATAYITQLLETQRRERKMRLLNLKDQIRRADHLLGALPNFHVSAEIRMVLIKYMRHRWQQIMTLERNPGHEKELARLQQLAEQPFDPGHYPAGSLTSMLDRDTTRRTRALLRELAQFLGGLQNQNLFSKNELILMIQQIKESYTRLTVELEILDTQETEKVAGPQAALHGYRNALTRLQRFGNARQIDTQINALALKLAQCEQVADRLREEAAQALEHQDALEREKEARKRYP